MTPTKEEARHAIAVLGAIQLAVVGARQPVDAIDVIELLLDELPAGFLDEHGTPGVELLVRLLRERRLQATVAERVRQMVELDADVLKRLADSEAAPGPGLCERVLVGRGTDTWDPLCGRLKGHEGPCE